MDTRTPALAVPPNRHAGTAKTLANLARPSKPARSNAGIEVQTPDRSPPVSVREPHARAPRDSPGAPHSSGCISGPATFARSRVLFSSLNSLMPLSSRTGRFRGWRASPVVLRAQFAGDDVAGFHIRLMERVDPDNRTGHSRRDFPPEEFLRPDRTYRTWRPALPHARPFQRFGQRTLRSAHGLSFYPSILLSILFAVCFSRPQPAAGQKLRRTA